jgi:uncharacterized membrane protein HdeD (DUF308 family)
MKELLQPNLKALWWMVLLRGIAALGFGVLAMFWPQATLKLLFVYFGAYLVVDGLVAIVSGLITRRTRWGWMVLLGTVEIVLGVIVMLNPSEVTSALVIFLALWALIGGAVQIIAALRFRSSGDGSWVWLLAGGALSLLFGIYFVINPLALAKFVLVVAGVFSVLLGVVLVAGAFRVRTLYRVASAGTISGEIV